MLVNLTGAEGVLDMLDVRVKYSFLACETDVVDMFGRTHVWLDLKLRVERSRLEPEMTRCFTQLQRERSRCVLCTCSRFDTLETMLGFVEVLETMARS